MIVLQTLDQPVDPTLTALAGLTLASGKLIKGTGTDTAGLIDITTFGESLIDDANASAARTTLGLGTIATQAASSVSITGGSVTGITDLAIADGGTGASTAANARTNLGVGTADSPRFAVLNLGDGTGQPRVNLNAASGQGPGLSWQIGGVARWLIYTTNAESGSNTGTDLAILAVDDSGTAIDSPITIGRAAGGMITVSRPVQVGANLSLNDSVNLSLGTTTGTKIGTATTQKLGFFNATPVVRPSAYTPTGVTTDRTFNANSTNVDQLADVLGTLIADLQSLGLIG